MEADTAVWTKPLAAANGDRQSIVDLEGRDHDSGLRHVALLHDIGEPGCLESHE
jgi:hypothetical protein